MRRAGTLLVAFLALAPAARAAPVTLAQIGTFSSPTDVTSPPGDGRLFVVEQGGRVRVVRDGATLARPFLDVSSRIVAGGEQGLLSIAFPSDYAASGLFYAYFTNTTGDVEVDQLRRSADPDVADPAYQRTLFTINHREFGNHNGGQLQFAPDGLLYAGTGDGGGGSPRGCVSSGARCAAPSARSPPSRCVEQGRSSSPSSRWLPPHARRR